jgi:aspartyl/asparaginyl beta-hydroxylase (cupin superfamily)
MIFFAYILLWHYCIDSSFGYIPAHGYLAKKNEPRSMPSYRLYQSAKGFGVPSSSSGKKKSKATKGRSLSDVINDTPVSSNNKKPGTPYVKSEQVDLMTQLTARAAQTCLGKAVLGSTDPFWSMIPSLLISRFPDRSDDEFQRVAGFLRHTLDQNIPLEDEIISNPHRPETEIHAYMPGLGPTAPFYDSNQLELCKLLSDNYDKILSEYDALVADILETGNDRFQSVTSMNYDAGWKTLVLFYNGHRIPDFPYHLCPATTQILETVPLAGRIAGFNRQKPMSGIPLHTDGNNMWLTVQMGIKVPTGAWIRVGPEKRFWENGECLLYDTTYEHETMNEHPTEERVVLHTDLFNTLKMSPFEIEAMQYIYSLREEFLKAEGVSKVGAQIL